MLPDSRSIQRFFAGLAEVCPIDQLDHLHLVHWPLDAPSPLDALLDAGFSGSVVVARASLAEAIRQQHPGVRLLLDDHPSAGDSSRNLLMELPQGREAAKLAIETALASLAPEGKLWLFGERESGIRTLAKRFSECETALCKGHLRLHTLTHQSRALPDPGRSTPFKPEADGFAYVKHETLKIAVKPGIFSWRAIDPATLLLLDCLKDESPGERLLDWGCGCGVIGTTLARRFETLRVILSDDLITATDCAKRTVEINQLQERCAVITEDGIGSHLSQQRFDVIVTNPPFHRGLRTDHDATLAFLSAASASLTPGGRLWLVGNRFLDYGALLSEQLGAIEEIDGDESFTVWRAIKERKPTTTGRSSTAQRTGSTKRGPTAHSTTPSRDPFAEIPSGRWVGVDELE
ncbi:MAG: methyltransferase [Magnetococcus sp. YQC-9]